MSVLHDGDGLPVADAPAPASPPFGAATMSLAVSSGEPMRRRDLQVVRYIHSSMARGRLRSFAAYILMHRGRAEPWPFADEYGNDRQCRSFPSSAAYTRYFRTAAILLGNEPMAVEKDEETRAKEKMER
ncbi:hypothetical protein CMQ_6754 [Grosmannia clavigera kw1407]|uniref:Uncharacterized protein n=1 Tax=Grosmannia clavigera (strain kw1407 / UAMH 11150) TaxID=655863 RepID=F0X7J6_GROCL|nr:uncharacterized protein CMQ_6754 [Grosmannia clavigera kw1407]EFX06433.1 hypothetical protein CMQ_6754 [Grosmannia clavigera kw1407]